MFSYNDGEELGEQIVIGFVEGVKSKFFAMGIPNSPMQILRFDIFLTNSISDGLLKSVEVSPVFI